MTRSIQGNMLRRGILLVSVYVITSLYALVFAQSFNFSSSGLQNVVLNNPTSLQFGPDGRLYVSQQDGIIKALTITRSSSNNYVVTNTETISLINSIPNHNDDGTVATSVITRQVTGILVTGTQASPVLYVSSSDSRIGGPSGDENLDTNSGIISRLTRVNGVWMKLDLVRGLPRSEENHSVNGMQLDEQNNVLYLAIGGATNAGAPSANFAYLTEYALSGAILSIDLDVIDQMPAIGSGNAAYKYDLPTVDDPTRVNNSDGRDSNDPWGGNDGLNQARIVIGGPVQVYSPGYRNVYDLVITKSPGTEGRLYTIDNGPNQGWGGQPQNAGPWGTVTNNYVQGEPGSTGPGISDPQVNNLDNLHYVGNIYSSAPGSHYGGHPTPIRANPSGAGLYTHDGNVGVFRTSTTGINPLPQDWPPVPVELANPIEGDYQQPGVADQALLTFGTSTNGITEYTASNFNGTLKGVLLAAGYNGNIFKILLTSDGTNVTNSKQSTNKLNTETAFASGFGSQPLDITAQGDNDIFPGSVWAATYGSDDIVIFEPQDMGNCTRSYASWLDDDADGYNNADELDNGTDPCSSSSKPNDFDLDFISDMNDSDDDNDAIGDGADAFALDPSNGQDTYLPIAYDLFNNDPGTGFFGLGFTGLMSNGSSNYSNLFVEDNLIAGGAIGAFSVVAVPAGDALAGMNTQKNGFQFGINTQISDGPFTVRGRILGPFFDNQTPQDFQSQGIFIGTGDQNNYLKIVLNANNGAGGIEVVYEQAGTATSFQYALPGGMPTSTLDLLLSVDAIAGTVQAKYAVGQGAIVSVGSPIAVSGALLTAMQGTPPLAMGIISTCRAASVFTATWDFIEVTADPVSVAGQWQTILPSGASVVDRHENAYVQSGDKFYLIGGRGIKAVQAFDPIAGTWANKVATPLELNHFQAVEINGLIYVVGAFTGSYPHETPVPSVYIYNPVSDKWIAGPSIPQARRRGSAAAVVYNDKIYLVCGILDGHWTGHVPWLDEYDPSTNTWRTLADAPRARDHFQAQIINGKIYVAGGRRSSGITNEVFTLTVPEVDVYDIATNTWSTLPPTSNIPTMRAGTAAAVIDNELLIIGGESAQATAHNETEGLNVLTNTWRSLTDLQQGRHGSQAVVNNKNIYIVAGSGTKGGSGELNSQERFYLFSPSAPRVTPLTASSLRGPASLSFGTIPVNTEKNEFVTLTNSDGNQAIVISSINMTGSAAFTMVTPYTLPIVIQPQESVVIPVKFSPAVSGILTASLAINHSGPSGSTTVPISGAGSAPGLDVNPTSLHFFAQEAGTSSSPQTVTFTNNTTEAINLTSVAISGANASEFTHNFTAALSVAAGASTAVNVTFSPNSLGTKVALLDVVHSGGNSPLTLGLTGEGSSNAEPAQQVVSLALMNAETEQEIQILTNASTLDLGALPTDKLNIRANTNPVIVGSVKFVLIGAQNKTATETGAPYALFGDKAGDYHQWVPPLGSYTLTVTPYTESGGGGDAGTPLTITFQVVNNGPTNASPIVSNPIPDQIATPGQAFTFTFAENTFSDADNDPLSYTSTLADGSPLPAWLQFSPATRTFSGTPSDGQLLSIRVVASDGFGGSAMDDFFFTVDDPTTNEPVLIRINSGGTVYTPADGTAYAADNSFTGGSAYTNNNIADVAGTVDDFLYKSERYGSITYQIAVPPGTYFVTLHFAEIYFGATGGAVGGVGKRVFNVIGEGVPLLTNFDIYAEVGAMTALKKSYQLEVADGGLTLNFVKVVNNPKISAIEVSSTSTVSNSPPTVLNPIPDYLATAGEPFTFSFASNTFFDPDGDVLSYSSVLADGSSLPSWLTFTAADRTFSGTPPTAEELSIDVVAMDGKGGLVTETFLLTVQGSTQPIATRINAGGGGYTASDGHTFSADNFFSGGSTYTNKNVSDITGTVDDAIYTSERYKMLSYNIPVPSGTYTLRLHFAEIYFGATGGAVGGVGKRVFDVSAEGNVLLANFDIYGEVGAMAAVVKVFVIDVTDGMLNIAFTKVIENPKISAIEVIPFGAVESTFSAARISGQTEMITAEQIMSEELEPQLDAYPNPFAGTTTLEYRAAISQQISLRIFDLRGALVDDVYSGFVDAGNVYTYNFDASGHVDGVYLARLTTSTKIMFVRLVLRR